MKIFTLFKQSLKAIYTNKGRSFLTILGIVIGIGSVIGLISLGTGVKASISDRIKTLGAKNITIIPSTGFGPPPTKSNRFGQESPHGGAGLNLTASTLTERDLKSLQDRKRHPNIKLISGQISSSAIFKTNNGDRRYTILGTSESYPLIENLSIDKGSFFNQRQITQKSLAAVLGSQMAADLYGNGNPIGKTLALQGQNYRVIGVLKPANESGLGNPNIQAYIPYTAAMATFKSQNFATIIVQARNDSVVNKAKHDIRLTLLTNHKIANKSLADFSVFSSADLLSAVSNITSVLTSLLAGIAAISLLVGGIGIMNIMLVSVTERTREIGLRKAVGAKTYDILLQFIMEAVVLTLVGGVLGIGLGYLLGKASIPALGFIPIVTRSSVALAVGVSSIVGLLFGVYPAIKAARLNPIDALRYE
ncbi:MAG: ABC transporter permease [Candidatus Saccharibacteria bacterium]